MRREKKLKDLVELAMAPICKEYGFIDARIVTNWALIVGEGLRDKCRPMKITFPANRTIGGTLFIEVNNPGFGLELSANEQLIVERIAIYFGYRAVSRVKLIVSQSVSLDLPPRQVEASGHSGAVTEKESEVLLQQVEQEVADHELKQTLKDLAMALGLAQESIARLTPIEPPAKLAGSMSDRCKIIGDIIEPIDVTWDAEQDGD